MRSWTRIGSTLIAASLVLGGCAAPRPHYPPPGPPPGYGAPPGYGPPPGYGAPPGYGPPPGYGHPPAPPSNYGPPAPGGGAPGAYGELGVHDQGGCDSHSHVGVDNVAAFAQWLGRRPDRVLDFTFFNSWSDIVRSTKLLTACWKQAGYNKLTFGVAMLPKSGATLAEGAAGAYDDYFRQVATALIAAGYPDTIIRLGWEFNIKQFPWRASQDPQSFVAFWQRIVGVMRATPGAQFRFDWNPSMDNAPSAPGHIRPDYVYPGDAYVDIIGLDVYNQGYGKAAKDPRARWAFIMNNPVGLRWQQSFAAQHGKPMSFPEWGTGSKPDGHGGNDDPYFMQHMLQWFAQNHVVYTDYWDEHAPDFNTRISDGQWPRAGAVFRQAFGGGG